MADLRHSTDGPSPLSEEGYDESLLPDFDREFLSESHLQAFASALSAPDPSPSTDDLPLTPHNGLASPSRMSIDSGRKNVGGGASQSSLFITAQNDWAPVHPSKIGGKGKRRGEKKKGKRQPRRSRDETREGYLYTLLKWPMLGIVGAWVIGLGAGYLLTRLYIWLYGMFPLYIVGRYWRRSGAEADCLIRTFHCMERETRTIATEITCDYELWGLGERC
jgi:hypothetical protein